MTGAAISFAKAPAMTQLFTNLRLLDPEANRLAPGALLVRDGKIAEVLDATPDRAPEGAEVIDCDGHVLAPGIVHPGVNVCTPGHPHQER